MVSSGQVSIDGPETLGGSAGALRVGMWLAWALFVLNVMYAAAVAASGMVTGVPTDPYWALSDLLTIIGVILQVILVAVIHEAAPLQSKKYSIVALGWMLVMAALTVSVHFTELIVARKIDFALNPALHSVFDFTQPSLLNAFELVAWHIFFSLSVLFASSAFRGRSIEAAVRIGLVMAGVLSIAGLAGPATGIASLRLIGVLGYGVIFPIVCVMMGFAFKAAIRGAESGFEGKR